MSNWLFQIGRLIIYMLAATMILPFVPLLLLALWMYKPEPKKQPAAIVQATQKGKRHKKKRRTS